MDDHQSRSFEKEAKYHSTTVLWETCGDLCNVILLGLCATCPVKLHSSTGTWSTPVRSAQIPFLHVSRLLRANINLFFCPSHQFNSHNTYIQLLTSLAL